MVSRNCQVKVRLCLTERRPQRTAYKKVEFVRFVLGYPVIFDAPGDLGYDTRQS